MFLWELMKLAYICIVLSCFSHVWLFVPLWTVAHQAPLSMGTLHVRILEWITMPFSRECSQSRDWTHISYLLDWQVDSLSLVSPGKPVYVLNVEQLHRMDIINVQFSSVAQSCPTLCDPMNCSTPGLPVHHQLPEFTQTRHPAITSSVVPFFSCNQSLPAAESFPMSQLFTWGGQSTGVSVLASFLPRNDAKAEIPGLISFRNGLVGSPCSPRDAQESSPTPQFKSINSLGLSFLYSPTLTSIYDPWKNHTLD